MGIPSLKNDEKRFCSLIKLRKYVPVEKKLTYCVCTQKTSDLMRLKQIILKPRKLHICKNILERLKAYTIWSMTFYQNQDSFIKFVERVRNSRASSV